MRSLVLSFPLLALAVGCNTPDDQPATSTDTGSTVTDTGQKDTSTGGDSVAADSGPKDTGSAKETSAEDTEPPDVPYVPSVGAKYFCDAFKTKCVFGSKPEYYTDYDNCTRTYDIYSTGQQICCGNELGKGNCEAASGMPPCDK